MYGIISTVISQLFHIPTGELVPFLLLLAVVILLFK